MKKNTLHVCAVLAAVYILLAAVPLHLFAGMAELGLLHRVSAQVVDSGACGDNLSWTLDGNGLLTVSGTGDMYNYSFANTMDYTTAPWGGSEENVRRIRSVVIESGVSGIGRYAFYYCENLSSITVPDSVLRIGMWAFWGTAWFNSQPDGIIYAGKVAYLYKGVTPPNSHIVIKDGTVALGEDAFHCQKMSSIYIPDSVINIGKGALSSCLGISSITIPNSVVSIEDSAFSCCRGLKSIHLPASVNNIGNGVFSYCEDLTSITVDSENKNYHAEGNCLIETTGKKLLAGCSVSMIPADGSVTSIGDGAFSGSEGLESVIIPQGVERIGNQAFQNCTELTDVSIPKSVSFIGSSAFSDCSELTSVTIPSNVYYIGANAYSRCKSLTTVSFEAQKTLLVGEQAFLDCTALEGVYIDDLAAWCHITFVNDTANPLYYAHCLYLNGINVREMTIPDGVFTISSNAFFNCTDLTEVTIPLSVMYIEVKAFYGCEGLKTVTFSGSESQWKEISISYGNDPILNAELLCTETAHDHIFGDWVVTSMATEFQNGIEERRCVVCDAVETREIPWTGLASDPAISAIDTDMVKEVGDTVYVSPYQTVFALLAAVGGGAKIVKANGQEFMADEKVGSGMMLIKPDGKEERIIVKGDVNGDGEITASDARFALRAAVKLEIPTLWQESAILVSGGKTITASDARLILRAAVQLETLKIA